MPLLRHLIPDASIVYEMGAADLAGYLLRAPLGAYARSNLNAQPTRLPGAGLGYGTAGSAISGVNPGPW